MNLFGPPRSTRRNSVWMIGSRTLRTAVAALYFTLLARCLGANGYGAFTAACAVIGIFSPFASFGSGNLLVQFVARDRSTFPERWAQCLLVTLVSGVALTAFVVAVAPLLLSRNAPLLLIVYIAIAELIFARVLDASSMAFQAFERLAVTGWMIVSLSISRLVAVLCLLALPRTSSTDWSALYLVSTAIPAALAFLYVARELGRPVFRRTFALRDLITGFYFAVSQAAQTIYNDIDKSMLARISGLATAGIYGAAYRVVDAAFSPVLSVLAATYARFFQSGASGIRGSSAFANRVLPRTLLYSLPASIALWIAAPCLPLLLGAEFRDSALVLRWLTPLLVLRNLHYLAADSLTGGGYQSVRTLLQLAVAALNIFLNLLLLPRYSWRGAVWTSLISDAALAAFLWLALWRLRTRESATVSIPHAPAMVEAQ